jgi:transcriptional regulator of arginine metabolism
MKAFRQGLILELVERGEVSSQEQLRRLLRGRGVDVTQATLSRDIAELGLVKHAAERAYRLPGASGDDEAPADAETTMRRAVGEYLRKVERVRELIVLRTEPGQAGILGIAIDRAALDEIAGTIAGDDTLLVVVRDARRAKALVKRIENWATG